MFGHGAYHGDKKLTKTLSHWVYLSGQMRSCCITNGFNISVFQNKIHWHTCYFIFILLHTDRSSVPWHLIPRGWERPPALSLVIITERKDMDNQDELWNASTQNLLRHVTIVCLTLRRQGNTWNPGGRGALEILTGQVGFILKRSTEKSLFMECFGSDGSHTKYYSWNRNHHTVQCYIMLTCSYYQDMQV